MHKIKQKHWFKMIQSKRRMFLFQQNQTSKRHLFMLLCENPFLWERLHDHIDCYNVLWVSNTFRLWSMWTHSDFFWFIIVAFCVICEMVIFAIYWLWSFHSEKKTSYFQLLSCENETLNWNMLKFDICNVVYIVLRQAPR